MKNSQILLNEWNGILLPKLFWPTVKKLSLFRIYISAAVLNAKLEGKFKGIFKKNYFFEMIKVYKRHTHWVIDFTYWSKIVKSNWSYSCFNQNDFQIASLTWFVTSSSFKTAADYVYISESIESWEKYSKQRR
jgi:hypothetical protein